MSDASFSQKLRSQLNFPIKQKNVIFKIFLPLLFLFAFIVNIIAKNRRKKSYQNILNIISNAQKTNLDIICIGNIIMGGTGKSPIVQAIAKEFLKKNYIVAIASRGMGKNIKPIYVNSFDPSGIEFLSDENREHFELLKTNILSHQVYYILQNPCRQESLKFFLHEKNSPKFKNQKFILLLDDGLQHFQCPRDLNVCVWDSSLLSQSPMYPFPVGPYREGFGKKEFKQLLLEFDLRFWSRFPVNDIATYSDKVKKSLNAFALEANSTDIFIAYQQAFYQLNSENNLVLLSTDKLKSDIDSNKKAFVVAGIANPQKFITDLKQFLNYENIDFFSLSDHGALNKKALHFMQQAEILFFTLKDYFRWCQHPVFSYIIKNKKTILCSIEVTFYNHKCQNEDIVNKLLLTKKV